MGWSTSIVRYGTGSVGLSILEVITCHSRYYVSFPSGLIIGTHWLSEL